MRYEARVERYAATFKLAQKLPVIVSNVVFKYCTTTFEVRRIVQLNDERKILVIAVVTYATQGSCHAASCMCVVFRNKNVVTSLLEPDSAIRFM